ncbi:MAG: hypothetical protein ACHQET_00860 [Chitinophagales bacterium]
MKNIISKEESALVGAKYMPAVSIILSFEPKMSLQHELEYKLKMTLRKVEKELLAGYTAEHAIPVLSKLYRLVHDLNYNTHKKSIAIFASPVVEKVFYLDVPVEEKIIIDESFEIRDLVYSKKQTIQYLILLLSGKSSKMWLGNCSKFILLKSNIPDHVQAYYRDLPERVANFSDQKKQKEILLDKFLRHMDEGLSLILSAYPLPVFVLAPERVIGHFKKITKHEKNIIQCIHGNYEEATEAEIREILKPHIADWNKIKSQDILQQIGKAKDERKLVCGIQGVWEASSHKNAKLLVVEKNFMFPAQHSSSPDHIYEHDPNSNNPFYIKDAVDDVMEKVLESGGDVEFVDNGLLENEGHIALIKFF